MTEGVIFNIQRFCVEDGPGIRTTVFFKGCRLRCLWCHNAESYIGDIQLGYRREACTNCGACQQVCPGGVHRVTNEGHFLERKDCIHCGACAAACPAGALSLCGQRTTADSILEEIEKDRVFYETSGGGVTLSGGEPLLQASFAAAVARGCQKAGITVAVETGGYVNWSGFEELLPYTDLWLYDIKETDAESFQLCTGGKLELVFDNLEQLSRQGTKIWLRCPVIPGVNDRKEHFEALRELKRRYQAVEKLTLLPYHRTGEYKKEMYGIGIKREFRVPSEGERKEWERAVY